MLSYFFYKINIHKIYISTNVKKGEEKHESQKSDIVSTCNENHLIANITMESSDFYEYATIPKEDYSKYCDNTFGIILITTLNGETIVVNSDKIESIKIINK